MSGISAISYIENFGRRAMSYLVGDDEPVGLAGCAHQPQTREDRLLINAALDEVDLNASPTRTYSCPDDTRAEVVVTAPPAGAVAPPGGSLPGALITWTPTLEQEMDSHDSANWQIRSGANDAQTFGSIFQPQMTQFVNGFLRLILDHCQSNCQGRSHASGEYRTRANFGYGYYETRMRPARGAGLMAGSFFTYTGVWGQASHNEIDFEFIGENSTWVQTNYYSAGTGIHGEHEQRIPLGFDATQDFHNYGFRWAPDRIEFYVDGRLVRTAFNNIPSGPSQIMVNLWKGANNPNIIGWLGGPYTGSQQTAEYDWIRYAPLDSRP